MRSFFIMFVASRAAKYPRRMSYTTARSAESDLGGASTWGSRDTAPGGIVGAPDTDKRMDGGRNFHGSIRYLSEGGFGVTADVKSVFEQWCFEALQKIEARDLLAH